MIIVESTNQRIHAFRIKHLLLFAAAAQVMVIQSVYKSIIDILHCWWKMQTNCAAALTYLTFAALPTHDPWTFAWEEDERQDKFEWTTIVNKL